MRIFLSLLLLLSLASCKRISVTDLVRNPQTYQDKRITVCGRVAGSINVFVAKGYILEDAGARVLVLTDKSVPHEGKDKCVTAIFSQAVKVPGFEAFVLDARRKKLKRDYDLP